MRTTRAIALAALICALLPSPAFADLTGFIGASTTPANRQVRGVAAGISLLVIGFEFEYAFTPDDPAASAPSLKTGMGNVFLQTPFPILGLQPYVTTGGGIYAETLGAHGDTGVGMNAGGGVKVSLIGPVSLRVDYRAFRLGSGALYSPTHRIYAGLNLRF
jgi:hypothetical protein